MVRNIVFATNEIVGGTEYENGSIFLKVFKNFAPLPGRRI
ncbi:hypothetical protein AXA84_0447 [Candidatus Phytoplasma oryzae]|uniref:Uncharacterized protein n=1 Tax=Candidatus Phytoplasma oryzae TaxID=203274 RepID=A0A139JPX3_9MOLU|nr:hypothetical protein AXA84_0447 [Candidatus Phytoplasma oryzae]